MAYIEKEKAQIFLRTECLAKYPSSFANGLLAAADQLNKLPTADVVEVVRCKDCKHFSTSKYHTGEEYTCCDMWSYDEMIECKENGFCSYGERKEK